MKPIEKCRELSMAIERKNMRDVLVRSHDDHAACVPIDAAHREDVVAALEVGAEHLFVVAKFRNVLCAGEGEAGMVSMASSRCALLENRTDIDHRIDIRARGVYLLTGDFGTFGQKAAQGPNAGTGSGGIARVGKDKDAPSDRPPWRRGQGEPAWRRRDG